MLESTAVENERLCIEDRLGVVPTDVPVDEEAQSSNDHAFQELPAALSQEPANVSREYVRRDAEECAPSTPRQVTQWAGSNSPVSSPTEMIRSSELPFPRWPDKINN